MPNTQVASGKCLCGSVSIIAQSMNPEVNACHCTMCTKWSGPNLSSHCGSDVLVEPADKVSIFSSSDWAERAFCSECGTHLYYRMVEENDYIIPIGIFDQAKDLTLGLEIFIDEKPDYYTFANDTRKMTAAEVYSMYAPKEQ